MNSGKYFFPVAPVSCRNWIPAASVIRVNRIPGGCPPSETPTPLPVEAGVQGRPGVWQPAQRAESRKQEAEGRSRKAAAEKIVFTNRVVARSRWQERSRPAADCLLHLNGHAPAAAGRWRDGTPAARPPRDP